MIHLYKVITFSRATMLIVVNNNTELNNIIKACNIDVAITQEIAKTDNIIISNDYVKPPLKKCIMNWYRVKLVNINNKEDIITEKVYSKNAIMAASLITKDFPGYLAFSSEIIENHD